MVFWLNMIFAGFFALYAWKKGFYESWALLFNIVISIYLAVFLRPAIANVFPAADNTAYNRALLVIAIGAVSFFILHGLSYALITGQFAIPFPKILDTFGAAFLGFVTGYLIFSFLVIIMNITPLADKKLVKAIGFTAQSAEKNFTYLCRWCDGVNAIAAAADSSRSTAQLLNTLAETAKKQTPPGTTAQSPQPQPAAAVEPNRPQAPVTGQNQPSAKSQN